jgi:hypothetical protein
MFSLGQPMSALGAAALLSVAVIVGCSSSAGSTSSGSSLSPDTPSASPTASSPVSDTDLLARLSCSLMSQAETNEAFGREYVDLVNRALDAGTSAEYAPLKQAAVTGQAEDAGSAIRDFQSACVAAGLAK